MRGYGYITVASGAVYLQWESMLENTRILTSRKHTRRQKRQWKKDPMLASRYSLQTLWHPKLSCKVLGSSPSLPVYISSLSIPPFSHCLADHRGLASTGHFDKKTREISMRSLQSEARSFTCLISPVFLGQGSVMQIVSTTQGLGYLMEYYLS